MINRIPIRWRLTLGFTLAVAILVVAFALLLRLTLAGSLDDSIQKSLLVRGDEAVALVAVAGDQAAAGGRQGRLSEAEDSFFQVLDSSGRVLSTSAPELSRSFLSAAELSRARSAPVEATIPAGDALEHRSRLLARPAAGGRVVVVGTSLEDRDETITSLTGILAVGGPIALIIVAGLGYVLARAALRPVAAIRDRAAEISGSPDGARLPLPPADDDIRELGETLNAMLDRIDGAMERERSFVADASHELRTPLGILKAEIELALTGERSHAELRSALVSAGEETDQLARLADDLLVLSRADHGGIPIRPERLALAEEIERTAGPFRAMADGEGRRLEVVAAEPAAVWADSVRFRQAIGNLLDNAIRHGAGTVTVRAVDVDGGVAISVEDEGPGVDPEFAPQAFERFTRSDPGRSGRGAGLGLAIVAAIADAHEGRADIASDGHGVATLTFPAAPVEDQS